jgi:hypothetical protein
MAKDKVIDRNHPKSLTTEQRLYLDQLVTRFGPDVSMVKRADLKKATQEILKIKAAPDWITRNLKCRCEHKRGRYDLSVLLKLPVVAFADTTVEKKPKKVKVPKVAKTPKVTVAEVLDLPVIPEVLDGIPLNPPTVKKPRKTKTVVPPVEPVV